MKLPPPTFDAIVETPIFSLGIRCDSDEVTAIEFIEPCPATRPQAPLVQEVVRQISAYLKDSRFEFGLPLRPAGTHFQRRVWTQISAIPVGQTRSYGEIATAIHSGPRAVGNACGANPYPVVVPCHRVLAANQALGGFGRGRGNFPLEVKQWLLQHEHR
jgi:methylated-DNA-[protein]-cysteine S-methyltransferase